VGVAVTNQTLWLYTNPIAGSLLRPKCKINNANASYPPLKYFHLLTALCFDNKAITFFMWVRQIPITSFGFMPTPIPVLYRTQTDYLKSMSSSNGT
jgi:hypothetical protein